MAAQIVRISVDKILGEPYKFKPQSGETKTEGGKAHEPGRSPESMARPVVARPPGVAPGEQPEPGEGTLREGPGEAGGTPEPGSGEGASGVHELEDSRTRRPRTGRSSW